MTSGLAIISKSVFEAQAPEAAVGHVVPMNRYAAAPKALDALDEDLYLVTVRPPDETLWLVAVLEQPEKSANGWAGAANRIAIVDISALKSKFVFANGKGLPAEAGKLGMSLQTPRMLTDEDVALLRTAIGGRANKPAAKAEPAVKAKKSKAEPAARAVKATTPAASINAIAEAKTADAALLAALAVWRTSKATSLADAIDDIAVRVQIPTPTEQSGLTKLAMSKDPLVLGALIAAVPETATSYLPTLGKMLSEFPDDPRLAKAIGEWIQDPPTTSSSTYPFWTALIDALVRIGDVRVIPRIATRLNKKPEKSQFWPKFYAALTKAKTKLEAIEAPTLAKLKLDPKKLAIHVSDPVTAPAPTGSLTDALELLGKGRLVDAITAMVARWREVRAPELADAIDRATRCLPNYDRPLTDAWQDLFDRDPNAAMPQLLLGLHDKAKLTEAHLAALATLPDDPRISYRCAEFCMGLRAGPERTQYWRTLLELIARHRDVRTLGMLLTEFEMFQHAGLNYHRQAKTYLSKWALAPGTPPTLDKADAAMLAKIDKHIAKLVSADEAELIDAIAAEPMSDQPRTVYADWLQEREHPRGELISLRLQPASKATDARIKELGQLPYIYGLLTDLFAYDQSPPDRGLYTNIQTDYRTGTLTFRTAAALPMTRLVTELEISRSLPTQDDLAQFVANAPKLAKITFETKPAKPYQLAGFTAKGGALVR